MSIYWSDRCLHAYDFMSTYVFEVLFENVFYWIYAFLRGDKKDISHANIHYTFSFLWGGISGCDSLRNPTPVHAWVQSQVKKLQLSKNKAFNNKVEIFTCKEIITPFSDRGIDDGPRRLNKPNAPFSMW